MISNQVKINNKSGFTLFEMIVSLGVFSIAVLMILSSLLSITGAQKKAITLETVEDNLRFAIDSISKEVRTGYDYDCGGGGTPLNCTSGSSILAFTNANGVPVVYKLENQAIQKSIDGGANFFNITGSDIKVNLMTFYVTGVGQDNLQPKVTIIIKAVSETGQEKTGSPFNVQTTVVQRQLDS